MSATHYRIHAKANEMVVAEFRKGNSTEYTIHRGDPLGTLIKADGFVTFHKFPSMEKAEEKLSEGQHRTPPKGYPTDKDQYAVPEFYLFPINNEEHTRAALGYFSHHKWKPEEHKKRAASKILRAAKKFGIDVDKDSDVYEAAHG